MASVLLASLLAVGPISPAAFHSSFSPILHHGGVKMLFFNHLNVSHPVSIQMIDANHFISCIAATPPALLMTFLSKSVSCVMYIPCTQTGRISASSCTTLACSSGSWCALPMVIKSPMEVSLVPGPVKFLEKSSGQWVTYMIRVSVCDHRLYQPNKSH